jgi:hypothetical protein
MSEKIDIDALRERIAALAYHHSASHITPDYRDGFNRAVEEVCGLLAALPSTDPSAQPATGEGKTSS